MGCRAQSPLHPLLILAIPLHHLGYTLRSFLSRHKQYEIIEKGEKQMLKTLLIPVLFFKET